MFRSIFFVVCILLIITACKELFSPELEITQGPLVVEGLITDNAKPYSIKLSRAIRYDSNNDNELASVSKATITVFDNLGYTYRFKESNNGVYWSDPSEFVGVPGRYYTLQIKTADDLEYQSSPQLLLPNDFNVKVSADYGTKYQLVDDGTGTLIKKNVNGTIIFYDIENNEDTLIRFKFDYRLITEWIIPTQPPILGWDTWPNKDIINLTDNYGTSTNNIEKHNVCFVPTSDVGTTVWVANVKMPKWVHKFVPRIIQYRLNNDAHQYYKDVNNILAATGKVFDPIASQVKGNMKCLSDNTLEVLGFFEVSSARTSYYVLNPWSKILNTVESFEPPYEFGSNLPTYPDWWIY